MRKVERDIVWRAERFLHDPWKTLPFHGGNTVVDAGTLAGGPAAVIRFHETVIAKVGRKSIHLADGGWRTSTTKSRINAVLQEFAPPGTRVFQTAGQWYLYQGGVVERWEGKAVVLR